MKRKLLTLTLAVLTVGLLGSCSKISERIDGLDKRVYDLENNKIASVEQQITAINTSINELKAADVTINGKIADLKTTAEALQTLIDALKEADKALVQKDEALEARIAALEGQVTTINGQIDALVNADIAINTRIDQLKSYVDTEIGKAKDWASATFATLAQYQQTAADLATLSVTVSGINTTLAAVQTSITTLDSKIDGIDAALQGKIADAKTELEGKIADLKTELEGKITEAISTSETNLKGWVNKQLEGYYTIAEIDVKIAGLKSEIDALDSDNEANKIKIAELETKLNNLSAELADAKATIKAEYEAAIKKAIEDNNGIITGTIDQKIAEVNATITALTGRVEALESDVATLKNDVAALKAMIQTVSIIPAYNNGSVKAEDGILTINCVITPKEAVESLKKENFTILTSESEVLTKSALYGTLTIAKDEDLVLDKTNGTATIKVNVSSVLPAEEDKALTVAVNIKNGISDFTTEFVPVYEPSYVEIKMTVGGQEKTYKWAKCNIGATKETDYGDYYAWGTTVKAYSAVDYSKTTGAFTFVSSNPYGDIYKNSWDASKGFNWVNTPFTSSEYSSDNRKVFTKYVPKNMKATYGDGGTFYDDKTVLDTDDDVARKVLGGDWRMPTEAEFKALCSLTKEWKTDYKGSGVNGYLFTDADGNSIFLPAAGVGENGTLLSGVGDFGYYWSSSLYTYAPRYAHNLRFSSSSSPSMDFTDRFIGRSVRAISE